MRNGIFQRDKLTNKQIEKLSCSTTSINVYQKGKKETIFEIKLRTVDVVLETSLVGALVGVGVIIRNLTPKT